MELKSREELDSMYKTEKVISVKTNELDYDTIQGIIEQYDVTEEELLAKCFQVGLYTIANSIIEANSDNPAVAALIKAIEEGRE